MDVYLDNSMLEAVFQLPYNDGSLPAAMQDFFEEMGARRPTVLLAFPPKAAGSFLRAAVEQATGGQLMRCCYAQGGRDAQPYLPTFIAYYAGARGAGPMVAHLHMQAFPANRAFVEGFGIRPVVMVRNIADMLASYWDMLEDGGSGLPMGINCTIPDDFRLWPAAQRADFMIDVIGPWYVGYYATWLNYHRTHPERMCLVQYADLMANPAGTLFRLLEACGSGVGLDTCRKAIGTIWRERRLHRFGEDVTGRGEDYFSPAQRDRLARMLSYYPATAPFRAALLEPATTQSVAAAIG